MNNKFELVGDILEFGTCTCQSAIELATLFPDKTIFTIDHFKGLERSDKALPTTSDWREGSFGLGAWNALSPEFPRNIDEALQKLSTKPNIKPIIEDIHKLDVPSSYGINEIAICNIDVDIYEPTVSALKFLNWCDWDQVFIRFDDWHGGEKEYEEHEQMAFKEWIEEHNHKYKIIQGGLYGGAIVTR